VTPPCVMLRRELHRLLRQLRARDRADVPKRQLLQRGAVESSQWSGAGQGCNRRHHYFPRGILLLSFTLPAPTLPYLTPPYLTPPYPALGARVNNEINRNHSIM